MIKVNFKTLRLVNCGRKTYLEIDGESVGKNITEVRFSHRAGNDGVLEVEITDAINADVVIPAAGSGPDVDDMWQQLSASKKEALNDQSTDHE